MFSASVMLLSHCNFLFLLSHSFTTVILLFRCHAALPLMHLGYCHTALPAALPSNLILACHCHAACHGHASLSQSGWFITVMQVCYCHASLPLSSLFATVMLVATITHFGLQLTHHARAAQSLSYCFATHAAGHSHAILPLSCYIPPSFGCTLVF